ncbi:MAG: Slp family lipoprotein [gamma proteobacterium endosymbiont of Lamellibrachia anaximandri]|nr:Slp family lipoprotein [gamma proteobacterium endosymbiont of Lamellibrachia anaximandri]MBL3534754.1 Slp family lipoprotein [gamma proteobacterium endosymbiont of Lamellibrachia anaximandri]
MTKYFKHIFFVTLCLFLAACAAPQTRAPAGDRSVTPKQIAEKNQSFGASPVEWGGVIMELRNLQSSSELEVIAYPLQENGKPDLDASPTGRFIAVTPGYLESVDYSKGRQVTISGPVSEIRTGRVGGADYQFPIIKTADVHLWPKAVARRDTKPRIHFGIGVGSGGYSRGGVGIGVGF